MTGVHNTFDRFITMTEHVEFKQTSENSHTILYRELEFLNFKAVLKASGNPKISKGNGKNVLNQIPTKQTVKPKFSYHNHGEDNYETFQKAMRLLLLYGQCLGLNPVLGISEKDVANVRFKILSWRFSYSLLICSAQAVATILCTYKMFHSVSITAMAYVSFYGTTCAGTATFMRVASKWPTLVKELSTLSLEEYIDSRVKFRCNTACIVLLSLGLVEHCLATIYSVTMITDCYDNVDIYKAYIENRFRWLFDTGLPYHVSLGIILHIVNLISTLNWNYSDLFIICMSFYLTALLDRINTKIMSAKGKHFPASFWRALREDYTRATRLVRVFDDVITSVVFISFASNLFFICLQLFNVLANGITSVSRLHGQLCPHFPSGIFGGYEHVIYYSFSVAILMSRSLVVSLIAASVHSASLRAAPALYDVPSTVYCDEFDATGIPEAFECRNETDGQSWIYYSFSAAIFMNRSLVAALVTASVHSASLRAAPALYDVPSTVYCDEIHRFIEQVHGDTVALSGLQFFYVTKELVLSIAGTIVTYELVLLQFNGEEMIHKS